jgi:murein DD-endopeptidase MepM/ murein hydrolase activator NlpD
MAGIIQTAISILLLFFLTLGIKTQYIPKLMSKAQIITQKFINIYNENSNKVFIVLSKKHYSPGENIILDYQGDSETFSNLSIKLSDLINQDIQIKPSITKENEIQNIKIIPIIDLKPGKYKLVIKQDQNVLLDSEVFFDYIFTQRKEIYKIGNKADLEMLFFDDLGNTICPYDLKIKVKNIITNKEQILSNSTSQCIEGEIKRYEAAFIPYENGIYIFSAEKNENKENYNLGTIEVLDSDPELNININAPKLIKSGNEYQIKYSILSLQDFEGKLVSYIPADLIINNLNNFSEFNKTQIIKLRLPFEGTYSITLGFADEPEAQDLKTLYKNFEIKAHDGIDYALTDGIEVLAADDGTVINFPQKLADYGVHVVLEHAWGGRTFYGHLNQSIVKVGQHIKKGELIGYSGHTGATVGPHLHFGMDFINSDVNNGFLGKIDPTSYLSDENKFYISMYKLTWYISLKKNEEKIYGFTFKTNNIDNFYPYFTFEAPQIFDKNNNLIFTQSFNWKVLQK